MHQRHADDVAGRDGNYRMTEIRIKRGAAFRAQLTFTDDFGVPIDLTTVTLASQLRTATDDLVATLPITVTNQAGVATIPVSAFYDQDPVTRSLRLCYAKRDETLDKGVERLAQARKLAT